MRFLRKGLLPPTYLPILTAQSIIRVCDIISTTPVHPSLSPGYFKQKWALKMQEPPMANTWTMWTNKIEQ